MTTGLSPTRRVLFAAPLFACAVFVPSSSRAQTLPLVRMRMGMTVEQLIAASTFPFGADPSGGEGNGAYVIEQTYDLQLIMDGAIVSIDGNAGPNLSTFIIVKDGVVTGATIAPQTDLLTLDQALHRARAVADQFVIAGLLPRAEKFIVESMSRTRSAPDIQTWEEARSALSSEDLTIAALNVFGGDTRSLNVGLSMRHGPRMQRLAGREPSPIDEAIADWREGREWVLDLEIMMRLERF